jgi:hypothetical protein
MLELLQLLQVSQVMQARLQVVQAQGLQALPRASPRREPHPRS